MAPLTGITVSHSSERGVGGYSYIMSLQTVH